MDDGYVYFYYYLLYGETGESIISEHGLWVLDFVWTWKKDVEFIEENTRIIVGHMRDIVTCKSGPALSYVRCCFTNFFFF